MHAYIHTYACMYVCWYACIIMSVCMSVYNMCMPRNSFLILHLVVTCLFMHTSHIRKCIYVYVMYACMHVCHTCV